MSISPVTTRHTLRPHPSSIPLGVSGLVADTTWDGRHLSIDYRLAADLAKLRVPAAVPAQRTDGLWRHTCFEAFVALPSSAGYFEYNFSPSGAWAAYRFDGYRAGMVPLEPGAPLALDCRSSGGALDLHVTLDLGWLADVGWAGEGALRLGLTAVIEEQDGVLSYWALAHASEKPDFHRAEGFVAAIS